ncbi:hypothetical protein APHAL10511_007468, partial [Amanita phalloides]
MVLDIVEVPESHTGANLAKAFIGILMDYGISDKILSVTCDNASNNDAMIKELGISLPDYLAVNHTCCFLHIINLVAKSIVKQFDLGDCKKKPAGSGDNKLALLDNQEELDEDEEELDEDEVIIDDLEAITEPDATIDNIDNDSAEDQPYLSENECIVLSKSIKPIKLVLAKLHKLAFKLIHSTTILGPVWKQTLTNLKMKYWLMPHDVATQWNLTFNMLDFAIQYQKALDQMTANKKNDLRDFELDSDDWEMASHLCNVLD